MKTRILPASRLSLSLAAALAALLAGPSSHAASFSWDGTGSGGTGDGAGVWDTATKWWNGSTDTTWTSGSDAVFGHGGAAGAVTLAAPTTVNSLTINYFTTNPYTLGTATQAITLNAGITMNATAGAVSIISPLISGGVQTWTNNSTSVLTFNSGAGLNLNGNKLTFSGSGNFTAGTGGGTVSGAGGITMSGTGRVILGAAATVPTLTYSGDTTVNSGIIQFSNNSSANTCLILQGGVYAEYYTATMNRALGTAANQIQVLSGASGFGDNGAAVMTINLGGASAAVQWGSTYFQPTTFVLGDATTANNGCSTVFQNPIDLNGADRTVAALGLGSTTSATLSGILSTSTGTAGLIKNGPAKLILSGANTFNGAVTVNQGILSVSSLNTVANANPLGKSSAAAANLSLAAGTTLQFTGAAASCDRSFTMNDTANGGSVTLDASGSGALNLTSTATPAYGTSNQTRTLNLTGSNTGTNILAAVLTDNGSGALTVTKNGAGLWTLSAANTYTGATTVSAGTLSLTGSLTGTAITTNGGIINESAAGAIGGAVSFTQAGGSGTSVLSGTNTYSGTTTVFSGTVQFSKQVSLYNNTPASWTAANINVKSLATLALNVDSAGTAGFSNSNLDTLLGNISVANSASQGLQSGAFIGLDTTTATGSTFTQGNLIADTTGTNGGVLGLAKLGTGTLILDKTNTYTGRTIISGGTLQLGSGGTTGSLSTSSVIVNNGILTINRSNAVAQGTDFTAAPITGTGSFTQAGSGNTTLSAANTFSGTTTVSGGTLTLTNVLALQNSALVTTGAGTVVLSGISTPIFGGLSGASGSLATIISSGYTGTSLTLNPVSGSVTYGGVISDSTPGMTLIKNGAGTQVLTGANTYTGTTTINLGTLTIGNGTLGSLNGTTGTALTFGGTGTFNVAEANGSSQGMGALTFSVGAGTVTSTAANATATQTLTFASLAARPAGATGNFTLATNLTAASNKIVLTSTTNAPLNNSGSNNPGLFFGTTEYARYDTTNNYFRAVAYGTDTNAAAIVATGATLGINDATQDVKISGAITAQTTASVNTLNLAALTLTFQATASTLSVNGILSNGGSIVNGTSASFIQPAAAGGELVIDAAGALTLNQIIQNNTSASSLTKSGTGTLTLNSAASTYSGGTVVNAGSITTATGGANTVTFFGSGLVTINPGATLALNNTYVGNNVTLNNASVTAGNSFGSTMAGSTITLNGISTFNITGNLTISGNMTGSGGLIKTGASNVPVTGTNSYTGPTTVSGGPLTFSKAAALYNGTTASWTPANITVASGATLGVNYGGASDFTNAQVTTLLGNLTTGISNNGLLAGSAIAFDTSNGSGNYSGNITDSTGAGGGSVGFNKLGGNTLTLSGNNTFTGPASAGGPSGTTGGTLAVYSFNSVNGGSPTMASSSLGRPTTVANGTITLGNGSNNQGVGLTYLGTGETTDRVLAMNSGIGAGGTALTLDQSGTGLLKFTSPFVFTGATGSRILQLQGSTAGTGEWAAVLADVIPTTLSSLGITKAGTGTWTLSAANTYTGVTTISNGALVLTNSNALPGGIGSTGGTAALTFNGGVLGLGAGDFTRNLALAGTVTGACFSATGGGWAAYGADRIVNLNNDSHQITWATPSTGFNGLKLILGNATATNTVDLQNPLDMGTVTRTIQVDKGAAAIDGKLSGVLTGSTGANLTKTGTGALALTNANTYIGTTTIQSGSLLAGTDSLVSTNGAFGNASSAIILGNGSTAATDAPAILINGAFTVGRAITVDSVGNTNAYNATIGGSNTTGSATYTGNITLGTNTQYTVTLQAAPGGTVEFTTGTWTVNNKAIAIGTAANTGTVKLSNNIPATTGGVTVNYGTLAGNSNIGGNLTINAGAHHALAVAATTGAQVTRAVTGTLAMAGSTLDLSAATTPAGGTYVLATASTAITGFGTTTINYNGVPGTVSVDTVSSPQRLLLTVSALTGYAGWAATNAPTGTAADDYNGDGVSNGVEYILGGDKNHNNLSKLPTLTTSGGSMIFSFKRDQTTVGNATVTIQVGTTLASWPDSYTVGTDTGTSSPGVTIVNGVPTGFDTVTLTVTQAPDVKKFARLNVVVP